MSDELLRFGRIVTPLNHEENWSGIYYFRQN